MTPRPPVILVLLGGCFGSTTPETAPAGGTEALAVLRIADMGSEGCRSVHEQVGSALPGVTLVALDPASGLASVRLAPPHTSAEAVARKLTELGCAASVAPAGTVAPTPPAPGVDPAMAAACEMSCAAHDVDEAKVVPQPGAEVGELVRCPVSGVVFEVKPDQPHLDVDGKTWFTCCGTCMEKLQADPKRFIRG